MDIVLVILNLFACTDRVRLCGISLSWDTPGF